VRDRLVKLDPHLPLGLLALEKMVGSKVYEVYNVVALVHSEQVHLEVEVQLFEVDVGALDSLPDETVDELEEGSVNCAFCHLLPCIVCLLLSVIFNNFMLGYDVPLLLNELKQAIFRAFLVREELLYQVIREEDLFATGIEN